MSTCSHGPAVLGLSCILAAQELPATKCGSGAAHSNIASTPIIAEKPYIDEENGKYTLIVP